MDISNYIVSQFPDKFPNSNGKIHAVCPFHDDKHPSFSIDINSGLFICGSASCGVRGNFPLFFKMMEGIQNWKEVYNKINGKRISKSLDFLTSKLTKTNNNVEEINNFPFKPFVEDIINFEGIKYLKQRGLGKDICDRYGIMYGRDGEFCKINIKNSLVFPLFDNKGIYKTFQIRYLNVTKKERWKNPINSPNKNYLYAEWLIQKHDGCMWIVEGPSDVWNLSNNGVQSVALFSKEASSSQINKINEICKDFELIPIVVMDGDASTSEFGKKDYNKLLFKELDAYGLNPKIFYLEKDEDPGSLSKDRIGFIHQQLKGDVIL